VLTFLPLAVAALISGTVLVENVFNIPGVGTQIVQSVLNQDYNVLQAVVLGAGVLVAVLNLITDLITAAIDPRARLTS
jgi:ABC-type dipeptide/oligopeptide/nickel transport system permease component